MPRLKQSQGTMIFTGTLGAMRTNAQFAACARIISLLLVDLTAL